MNYKRFDVKDELTEKFIKELSKDVIKKILRFAGTHGLDWVRSDQMVKFGWENERLEFTVSFTEDAPECPCCKQFEELLEKNYGGKE